jgi:molybdenum cofactor biosynthesis enzyme MoaA
LRFLETVVNNTNNQDNRMQKYLFSEGQFLSVLKETDFPSFHPTSPNIRSSVILVDEDGYKIKFISSFCNPDCTECPNDKTSLWLTSTGEMKLCSYRSSSIPVKNWSQAAICRQFDQLRLEGLI